MSGSGHAGTLDASGAGAIMVAALDLASGQGFQPHEHDDHQLAWVSSGALTVGSEAGTWVLPPTLALWLPAGTRHSIAATGPTAMWGIYFRPDVQPGWNEPTVVAAHPLLQQLIMHLANPDLADDARLRAEAVLLDQLDPVAVTTLSVPWPVDDRAQRVATALVSDASDSRTLDQWGRIVGASGRTLARAFTGDTGMTFGRWRTHVRLRAALVHLSNGEPVSRVAGRVGYLTPSAFVAAFKQTLGVSPGAYFSDRG